MLEDIVEEKLKIYALTDKELPLNFILSPQQKNELIL
jgi:hypothetical protein